MITNEAGIAEGQMGIVTHDVELLTGVKPKEVADLIDESTFGKIKLNIGEIYFNILIIEYKKLRIFSLAFYL